MWFQPSAHKPARRLQIECLEGRDKAVLRYDGTTGAFRGVFADDTHLTSPLGIIFGPDGNLYVADFRDGQGLNRPCPPRVWSC